VKDMPPIGLIQLRSPLSNHHYFPSRAPRR
jgi:hypothetical protein